ncbi:MAG: hypothetical protein ACO1QB_13235 [Verrucomicrobiales bacterium]
MVRELPSEVLGIDVAATKAFAAARGNDAPVEVDLLYMEGGTAKVLHRWKVENVSAIEGVRMRFDWILLQGVLERVQLNPATGSPLSGSVVETIPLLFSAFGEQPSGDRSGPATLGILNPATDKLRILGRDNITVETNLLMYAVFDANENGRFDDDAFYSLDTNVVIFARLPKRPFAIVGVDEQGNVGGLDPFSVVETRNFLVDKALGQDKSEYEKKLIEIRNAIRGAINEGLTSPIILNKFLLSRSHIWIFEQGSGANLWKPDFVRQCNGIYLPGKSDNDYELFFPVKLDAPYTFDESGRSRFRNDGPYESATLRGDWYFKRPTGLDAAGNSTEDDGAIVAWQFSLPSGFAVNGSPVFEVPRRDNDDDPATGFKSRLTPAEIIARVFTRTITENKDRRKLIPDTTFFPERQEHFMFGQLHLERPPEFGDDPIGDGGTGRQLLLLKWLLEGAYVTTDDGGTGGNTFSPTAPSLLEIFNNWKATGVPLAEGFEWGIFQDFAALKTRPFQVVSIRLSSGGSSDSPRLLRRYYDDAASVQQASRIKKLGKAAIRATLARLAGDTNLNFLVSGVSGNLVGNIPSRSFEGFILDLVKGNDQAKAVFGSFAEDRDDLTEPPDLGDFLRAKNAERAYLESILKTPGSYERFVTTTFRFLRQTVQTPTRSSYHDYTTRLQAESKLSELFQRRDNLNLVVRGRSSSHPGILALNTDQRVSRIELPLAVEVYSPRGVGEINITANQNSNENGPLSLGGGISAMALPLPANLLTSIDGAPDEDETVGDGTIAGEGRVALEGSAAQPAVGVDINALINEALESAAPDNNLTITATAFDPNIPPPIISAETEVFIAIQPGGNENLFLFDDWPANETGPQSARYYLRESDQMVISVWAPPGLAPFTVSVASISDPLGRQVRLEDPIGIGVYRNHGAENELKFSNLNDFENSEKIYLQDEELLNIKITGTGFNYETNIMTDLGELSIASLDHADRNDSVKARFDYLGRFFNAPDAMKFFRAGFIQFDDDVAAVVNGRNNVMRQYIQAFADPAFPEFGESDILYINTHGTDAGQLLDHINRDAPPGARQIVLDPVPHLTTQGHWRSDAEWAILDACSTLNPVLNEELLLLGIAPGAERWKSVLTNLNGATGRRIPHGVLGFHSSKPPRREPHQLFINLLESGAAIPAAWDAAMTVHLLPWASLHYHSATVDTLREVSQDPSVTNRIVYHEATGLLNDEGCDDSINGSLAMVMPTYTLGTGFHISWNPSKMPDSSQTVSSTLAVVGRKGAASKGGLAQFDFKLGFDALNLLDGNPNAAASLEVAKKIFGTKGINPDSIRYLGFTDHHEIEVTGTIQIRKQVARVFHWQQEEQGVLVDGALLALKITHSGEAQLTLTPQIEAVADGVPTELLSLNEAVIQAGPQIESNYGKDGFLLSNPVLLWRSLEGGADQLQPVWRMDCFPVQKGDAPIQQAVTLYLPAAVTQAKGATR